MYIDSLYIIGLISYILRHHCGHLENLVNTSGPEKKIISIDQEPSLLTCSQQGLKYKVVLFQIHCIWPPGYHLKKSFFTTLPE